MPLLRRKCEMPKKAMENKTGGKENGALLMLGLAARAGKLVFGTEMVCGALRMSGTKRPCLVVEAADTSLGTNKKLTDKCTYYNVKKVRVPYKMEELAAALGKSALVSAVGVLDENLAAAISGKLDASL